MPRRDRRGDGLSPLSLDHHPDGHHHPDGYEKAFDAGASNPTPYPTNLTHHSTTGRRYPNRVPPVIAGGHARGATPVPIPNTAVKTAGPMILRPRESRSPPALNEKPPRRLISPGRLSFCAPLDFATPVPTVDRV